MVFEGRRRIDSPLCEIEKNVGFFYVFFLFFHILFITLLLLLLLSSASSFQFIPSLQCFFLCSSPSSKFFYLFFYKYIYSLVYDVLLLF